MSDHRRRKRPQTNWILCSPSDSNESHLYRKLSTSRYTDVESFDCPVCYSMVVPPIRIVCENLHTVCNRCIPHLRDRKCPKCRLPMDKILRSFELEHILRLLLSSPNVKKCKYSQYGCEFVAKSSEPEERRNHQRICYYQYVKMTQELDCWCNTMEVKGFASRMGRLWMANVYQPKVHRSSITETRL